MSGGGERREPRHRQVWGWMRTLAREVQDDSVVDAAAAMAFWLILSLPAGLLAVLASVSFLGPGLAAELEELVLDAVDRVFTAEADGLRAAVSGLFDTSRPGLLSLSVALAVFTLSRGFAGLIRAFDVVYDVEEARSFLRLRLAAIGLAIGTQLVVAISTLLWVTSRSAGVPDLLRVPMAIAVLVGWAATVYHVGPNHHTPWRYDLPGALFTAVGWLAVSLGFEWYIRIAGSGNELVGAAGALLVGLTWLWVVCLILLVGGEINEIIASRAGVVDENRAWRERLAQRVTTRGAPDASS